LEISSTPGGVWAKHRLYPGLKSNNMLGTYEYPDFPLDSETFGIKAGEHIPGTVLHEYLTKYAEKFGIMDKIRCNSKVVSAEHKEGPEGGWILTVQDTSESAAKEKKILARKLILATGLTSEAFLPDFKGQDTFGVPLFHTKDFKQHADTLDSAKTVTVFGGTKSSFDAVYAYASKGIKVNWVIRETGHGPIWIAPPYVTPLKKWLEKLVRK
jgi:cation diffusion facilitator CzcD-associated flavoprotein CzcO